MTKSVVMPFTFSATYQTIAVRWVFTNTAGQQLVVVEHRHWREGESTEWRLDPELTHPEVLSTLSRYRSHDLAKLVKEYLEKEGTESDKVLAIAV